MSATKYWIWFLEFLKYSDHQGQTWQDSAISIQSGYGLNVGGNKLVKFLVTVLFPQGPPTFSFLFSPVLIFFIEV